MKNIDINSLLSDVFDEYMKQSLLEEKKVVEELIEQNQNKVFQMFDGGYFNQEKYNSFDQKQRTLYSALRNNINALRGELNMIQRLQGQPVVYYGLDNE